MGTASVSTSFHKYGDVFFDCRHEGKALHRRLLFVARVIRPPAKRDEAGEGGPACDAIALRAMPGSDDPGHNFVARPPIRHRIYGMVYLVVLLRPGDEPVG